MPDASDLADAPPATPVPAPLADASSPQLPLPVPSGAPADVPPPQLAPALPTVPTLPTAGRPSLPTSAKAAPSAPRPPAPSGDDVADQDTQAAEEPDPMAAAAASGNPHAMAAAAHFASMKQAAALPQVRSVRKQKRRRSKKPVVIPVLLLGVLAGAAYVGRDSTFMTRLQGEGYDADALPMIVYPRPTPAGVERSITEYSVIVDAAGVPTAVEEFGDILSNPNTGEQSIEQRTSTFAVVDGVPAEPASSVDERELIVAGGFLYLSPTLDGEPWTQRDLAWRATGPEAGDFWMYQDLVDQSLRHVRPVEAVAETIDADEVTTYRWEIPFGELYESAPFAYSPVENLDGNADPASIVKLTISVDADGVVRVMDIRLDVESVIEHATAKADQLSYPYGYRVELDSLDDTVPTITAPTNVAPVAPEAEGGV